MLFAALFSRGPRTAFVPPFARSSNDATQKTLSNSNDQNPSTSQLPTGAEAGDERLKQFEQKIVDLIMSEVRQLLRSTAVVFYKAHLILLYF